MPKQQIKKQNKYELHLQAPRTLEVDAHKYTDMLILYRMKNEMSLSKKGAFKQKDFINSEYLQCVKIKNKK